jgi:hypothetical protein
MVGTNPAFDSNRKARCSCISKTTASSSARPHKAVTKQSSHAALWRMMHVSHEMIKRGVVDAESLMLSPS